MNRKFDDLCKALEVKAAKQTIAEYEGHLEANLTETDRETLTRLLAGQYERLERAKRAQKEWWA